jgi:hypothetical protein
MIKSVLVCVRDKKGAFYHPPYCVPTKEMAIRGFGDAVLKGNSDLSSHPEDFTLFLVGEFDQINGFVASIEPLSIATGLDFVDKE